MKVGSLVRPTRLYRKLWARADGLSESKLIGVVVEARKNKIVKVQWMTKGEWVDDEWESNTLEEVINEGR